MAHFKDGETEAQPWGIGHPASMFFSTKLPCLSGQMTGTSTVIVEQRLWRQDGIHIPVSLADKLGLWIPSI